MSVTIRKIAEDLQLAVSTVSKALRDSHEISPETKQRVFSYAQKLDYIPNLYASSLKKRKTGNIAVVLPEVADSFFSQAINGIEAIAQEKGYHVMIYLTHEDVDKEGAILRDFRSGRVDGVLMSVSGGGESSAYIQDFCARNIPVVFFDRACEALDAFKVLTDDFESGLKATELLIRKGCRRIAFLAVSEALAIIHHRQQGYEEALRRHGLEGNSVPCSNVEAESYSSIRETLVTPAGRPDGIIGSVEKLATLAYTVCNDLNLNIPGDIKIIGFSSLQIASLLNPSLTTVTQPAFEMGKTAATLLFDTLEKKQEGTSRGTVILPSQLVERNSTG